MTGTLSGFRRLYSIVGGLSGWRRRGLAAGLGILAAGALPPLHLVFLLIPGLTGLLWLSLSRVRTRGAFVDGWWFGAGLSGAGTFWISHSLTIDLARFGWLIPIAVLGFAAVLGLFPAIAAALVHRLAGPGRRAEKALAGPGIGAVLVLAGAWTMTEWLRGWVFTGFPWNLAATVWTFSDAMTQSVALFGAYGLGLVTVAIAAAPAALAGPGRRPWAATVVAAVFLLGLWGGGTYRLNGAEEAFAPGVQLRLVQPNIAQADKWKPELKAGHVARQLEMSYAPPAAGAPAPTHIIWAETAAPYVMNRQPNLIRALAEAAPVKGALITGALRVTGDRPADALAYNSLYVVEASGRIADVYDKHHLVPFGEYVPFEDWLSWLKITVGRGNFSPGPGGRVLDIQGLPPVSPLICYEVIFPGAVVPTGDAAAGQSPPRPRWLLNITNDAWFGVTPGPYQHFSAARLRAVEEGVALVRVANTGISAIVDPWGRVLKRLDLDTSGTLDGGLPEPIGGRTVYSLWGNAGPLGLALLFLGLGGFLAGRAGQSERP